MSTPPQGSRRREAHDTFELRRIRAGREKRNLLPPSPYLLTAFSPSGCLDGTAPRARGGPDPTKTPIAPFDASTYAPSRVGDASFGPATAAQLLRDIRKKKRRRRTAAAGGPGASASRRRGRPGGRRGGRGPRGTRARAALSRERRGGGGLVEGREGDGERRGGTERGCDGS